MKNIIKVFLFIIIFCSMFACVPRKQLVYLQTQKGKSLEVFTSVNEEYRLKPHDVVSVNIFSLTPGQFDIFGKASSGSSNIFTIDANGILELPAVGDVEVKDLTVKEAQDTVRVLLEDYLRSPLVRITLQTPFKFTVLGEVKQAGQYTKVGEKLTLLEALGTAGDLTRYADRAHIKIVRKNADGMTEIASVNVLEDNFLASDYYHLHSEDVIIVDPLGARSTRENQLFFLTSVVGILTSVSLLLSRFLQ